MGCEAQLAWKCPFAPILFRRAILTSKVGQSDLFSACDQDSSAGLCTQDYKSLCAAVTTCATVVNIQTHIHAHETDSILTSLYEKLSQLS